MKRYFAVLMIALLFSSCATSYRGADPDFSKSGEAAKAEYKKFEMDESFGKLSLSSAKMGEQRYYLETVEPIIKNVSSSFEASKKRMQISNYFCYGFLSAALVTLFLPQDSWAHQAGFWVFLGGALGSGVYMNFTAMNAAGEYNKDLKSRFTPSLALTKVF